MLRPRPGGRDAAQGRFDRVLWHLGDNLGGTRNLLRGKGATKARATNLVDPSGLARIWGVPQQQGGPAPDLPIFPQRPAPGPSAPFDPGLIDPGFAINPIGPVTSIPGILDPGFYLPPGSILGSPFRPRPPEPLPGDMGAPVIFWPPEVGDVYEGTSWGYAFEVWGDHWFSYLLPWNNPHSADRRDSLLKGGKRFGEGMAVVGTPGAVGVSAGGAGGVVVCGGGTLDVFAGAGGPAGFGRLIGWGVGAQAAANRTAAVTLAKLQASGSGNHVACGTTLARILPAGRCLRPRNAHVAVASLPSLARRSSDRRSLCARSQDGRAARLQVQVRNYT